MRVLIFQAAASTVAIAAMTRFWDDVQAQKNTGGLRSIQHFRNEPEPCDAVIVAVTDAQAKTFSEQLFNIAQVFKDHRIIPVSLPDDDEDLQDFDFSSTIDKLDEPEDEMSLDELRAAAIERGLEVTVTTTRDVLLHMLDLDRHPGEQAADRQTDRENSNRQPGTDRIGLRTSHVLPTVNGLDLTRMNDEQLRAAAAGAGIRVGARATRKDLMKKLVEKAGGDPNKVTDEVVEAHLVEDPAKATEADNSDLDDKSAEELQKIAEAEEIDVGRSTSVDGLKEKIVEARAEKAKK